VSARPGSGTPTNPPLSVSAPLDFSFACINEFFFHDPSNSIRISFAKVQFQPWLTDHKKFSQAYDCIGVLTPGIASGIFISFILISGLTIGIVALLDIKTPKRFENQKAKRTLSFYIQDKVGK
jgi:hypothetical protein